MSCKETALWLQRESGALTIAHSGRDVLVLLASRFIRQIAYGCSTLVLAPYFKALGHTDTRLGFFMTVTLLGDVLVGFLLTGLADSVGRRKILVLGAVLMAASGAVFATTGNYWALLGAAVIGVISPSGNEIGPFKAIEESTLAHLADDSARSDTFAWYVLLGTLGMAIGTMTCGWLVQTQQALLGRTEIDSFRAIFWIYSGLGFSKFMLCALLSEHCERHKSFTDPATQGDTSVALLESGSQNLEDNDEIVEYRSDTWLKLSKYSRAVLIKVGLLFAVNSLGSGMVPLTLVTYYVEGKFNVQPGKLGSVMSGTIILSAVPALFSSAISKRIGSVETMVLTHLPSAIFLALTPAPSSLGWTIFLIAARSSIGTMDQAPCSVFLSGIFPAEDLTKILGILNVAKMLSQSGGPVITGILIDARLPGVPFITAGGLKVLYDVGLMIFFTNLIMLE